MLALPVTSPLPYFVISVLFLLIANLITQRSGFYQDAISKSRGTRHTALDGFRGFLATGVFFVHVGCTYSFFHNGTWQTLPSTLYNSFLGEDAVTCFFMITGFLLWSKVLNQPRFDIKQFYLNRCLRIYPMYWFSLLIILMLVARSSGFNLQTSLPDLATSLKQWLTCRLLDLSILKGYLLPPDINEVQAWRINAGITWTLGLEVNFYLLLPLLKVFTTPIRFVGLVVLVVLAHLLLPGFPVLHASHFLWGMGAAYIYRRFRLESVVASNPVFSVILIGLAMVCATFSMPDTIRIVPLFIIFLLVIYGNSAFGILTSSAARYLGIVSYDLYLLHGILLFVVFFGLNRFFPVAQLSPILFWGLSGMCGLVLIFISGMTYRYIAYPFLALKH